MLRFTKSWFLFAAICPAAVLSSSIAGAQQAAQPLEKALEMVRPTADPNTLVSMLQGVSFAHLQDGNIETAVERISEAVKLCRDKRLLQQVRPVLMIAAQVLRKTDPDQSTAFLARLLKLEDDPEIESIVLEVLGQNLIHSGRVVLAMQVYHDYYESVKKQNPDSIAEAEALLDYGRACVVGRLPSLAIPALTSGMELAEKHDNPSLAALFPMHLGMAALRDGQYEFAEKAFSKQLQFAETSKDQIQIDMALINLALAYFRQEKSAQAYRVLSRLEQEGSGELMKATATTQLAIFDLLKDHVDEAVKKQSAAIERKLNSYPRQIRAMMGGEVTLHDQVALASYQVLNGELDAAEKTLDSAEAASIAATRRREEAVKVGGISADESNLMAAGMDASISEFRQQIFVSRKEYFPALLAAEVGRGRAQKLLMQARLGLKADEVPTPNDLTLEDLVNIARTEQTTIVEYSLVHRLDEITRSTIGENHSISQPHALYIWVIKPNGELAFRSLTLTKPIRDLVSRARQLLRTPPSPPKDEKEVEESKEDREQEAIAQNKNDSPTGAPQANEPSANQLLGILHELLITPIADELPADPEQRVTIVPQGVLFLVPFAALPDSNDVPLIAKHTLLTAPSIEIIRLAAEQQSQGRSARGRSIEGKDILVVGNPKMPSILARPDQPPHPLEPLQGAEIEAKLIARMVNTQPLVGEEATETAVSLRMKDAAVIHLASHGLLEADNVCSQSYLSAIALAEDDQADGYLTVRETMRMELDAELAILSACDSGRGRITGDGVLGLSRGFITAGVPSVIVSLWPVSDQATAVLMTAYYRALLNGDDKASALRKAMLATRERFAQPRLWAPFTLYGVGG